ncbi:hypothetical protein L195_g016219 [Trifolium pratense]|uniref:Uncharacterized protein n=1 Tax=Trifolium pratense TaxID=57577 RepID=A0A2K3MQI1_TRIPR|nr:hypothetical protein L195_g016219 [Trifolium pratense]
MSLYDDVDHYFGRHHAGGVMYLTRRAIDERFGVGLAAGHARRDHGSDIYPVFVLQPQGRKRGADEREK